MLTKYNVNPDALNRLQQEGKEWVDGQIKKMRNERNDITSARHADEFPKTVRAGGMEQRYESSYR